jgi:hypothetical protein
MNLRLAGSAAAFLVFAAALPASALSQRVALEMRGTITLRGSTSFVRELVLTKPFRITPAHRTVSTSGGRYSGFVLRKHGKGVLTTQTVASMVPGYCDTRGCVRPGWAPSETMDLFTGYATTPGQTEINAPLTPGRYWIALIADGKPVSVTLRFPGSGRTTVTTGARISSAIDVPDPATYDPETPAAATGQLYSAGATRRTRAGSLFYYLTSWKFVYGPPKSVNQQGVCTFEGPPVEAPTGAYQYPCGGDELLNFYAFGQRATNRKSGPGGLADEFAVTTDAFGVHEVDGAALSLGGFINGPSPSTSAHTTILWVDFP